MLVAVVLLAVYVSAGRQFMPSVSNYASFFENQIFKLTGLPVSIESLTGGFEGFNPSIQFNGLQLLVGRDQNRFSSDDTSALIFDSATIIIDIPRSLQQLRWVLSDFVVETLEVDVEQTAQGNWQLSGTSLAGDRGINLEAFFEAFQRVSTLNLRNVVINVETNLGNSFTLGNGLVTVQNLEQTHFLHINANLEQSGEQIAFSFEVEGNELSEIDGQVYIDIPPTDFSRLLRGQPVADYRVEQLVGGGNFW